MGLDGKGGVEEEDAAAGEGDEVATGRGKVRRTSRRKVMRKGERSSPVLGNVEGRVLLLDLLVDVAKRGRDLNSWAYGEAEACEGGA